MTDLLPLQGTGRDSADWVYLANDRVQLQAHMNMLMTLRAP
jgi:hypothetical protein